MKIRYTEELLKDVIRQQIFPIAPKEVAEFPLDHLVISTLKKADGEKMLLSCILDVNEHGILAILLDSWNAEKTRGYQYYKFSDMQGIRIKSGMLFCYITLQFKDGTKYVFQIMKRGNKHLPNQSQNLQYISSLLNNQNLNNMHNKIHKKRAIKNKITDSIYIVTLILFVIIALNLSLEFAPNGKLIMVVFFLLGAAIIHFCLYIAIALYIDKRKDKHFVKAYNQIMKAYNETDNAEIFLHDLSNIKDSPKTRQSANAFYFSMSTALYKNNKKEEALSYLNNINTSDKNLERETEKQRKMIEDDLKI